MTSLHRGGALQHLRMLLHFSVSRDLVGIPVGIFFHDVMLSVFLEYAAAFFLLGGSLRDAVNVCTKQLGDFQLAVALARIVEQSSEGPVLQGILKDLVLPIAFELGNRWLGSWAFWLLHRRDLAVRILLVRIFLLITCSILLKPLLDPPARHFCCLQSDSNRNRGTSL